MTLRLQFDASQPHQLAAIANVVDLLDGLPRAEVPFQLSNELVPNLQESADLADYWLEENLHAIQQRHNAEHLDAALPIGRLERDDGPLLEGVSNDSYGCPHFTIEMETGTGKTYVYFRTMHELHRRYGLRKFIVVVPSVAILEGVKKTFEMTKSHFVSLYGINNFGLLEYDGAHPGKIGSFAKTSWPMVMVITQQSFNQQKNNFYKPSEKLPGEWKPYQWVQGTRPVVILDEPQNMGSQRACEAIRTLKPLFVLRYSATHRQGQQPNPVYRLTPVQAFRFGLVKQIEVVGVAELGMATADLMRLEQVERNPLRARVRLLRLRDGRTTEEVATLKHGDTLAKHTRLPEHKGFKVVEIKAGTDGDAGTVEFSGGAEGGFVISTNDAAVGSRVGVWRAQIERTIEAHFKRQRDLRPLGVKVLSLFFIDRVANYVGAPGTIRKLFDECYDEIKSRYPEWKKLDANEVQSGYFAKKSRKERGSKAAIEIYVDDLASDSEEAKAAFRLIMQKKETLLSFPDGKDPDKNVAFIFAHSALKEGWDNPNVFQICTLNQTASSMKKRQEIGRGLRLCVDQEGRRPDRSGVNILTVIANESYESYVKNLQQNYVEDGEMAPPPPRTPAQSKTRRRDALLELPEFRAFWRTLCKRLTYTIEIDSEVLIDECARRLASARFPEPVLTISRGRFIVVDYTIRLKGMEGRERVRLLVEERSSEGTTAPLGFVEADDRETTAAVGQDLAVLFHNPHFRGFKVTEIRRQYGEARVRFTNDVEVSESETCRFQATRIDEHPNREMVVAKQDHPVPDFIGRASDETRLTRATLIRILERVSSEARQKVFQNPEGWANVFVSTISEAVKDHVAARVRYHDTGEPLEGADPDDPGAFFPAEEAHPQKEMIAGGQKSLYDQVQIDSGVERDFVQKRLIPDEGNICFYFKFPSRFRIEVPRVIGNYNPDWGIVRFTHGKKFTLELIRETKGSEDIADLRFANEGRKITIARRYFRALGIDYRHLTAQTENYHEPDAAQAPRLLMPVPPSLAPRPRAPIRRAPRKGHLPVPVLDLRVAAGAFSDGQDPQVIDEIYLPVRVARLPGLFAATVVGDSMNRVAPPESLCLWQHLGAANTAAAQPGERVIARKPGHDDNELGEFTFKRWVTDGRIKRLEPMSTNPQHEAILVERVKDITFVARFLQVLEERDPASPRGES